MKLYRFFCVLFLAAWALPFVAQPASVISWGTLSATNAITNAVAVFTHGAGGSGTAHGLALLNNGTVAGWGANQYGQATPPANLTNAVGIAAGPYFSLAVRADGTAVSWGRNLGGESSIPPGLTNVIAVSASFGHGLALLADGTVRGWGSVGGLASLSNAVAIASGQNHNLALRNDGTVVAWGSNLFGQTNVPAKLYQM
ncbi:RCC1 domain-containing protein [Pedosphaera parvula]|uniref:Alpha-tubulin suppressor and related RCC1domain-containing protein n=1 Tax=Pedosphaera parvula (strain Ellin514) TaxID=320771 RepID=B9XJC1_PEDPL|nr:alpha-tubulin suppressor and related RCC1domain-containing protein [Pedosphaera parvula]EEF59982.1 alpha-tubulin suppressor and related RCC1domain-containing protein [Pedosphaera parvula Ellin514]